MVRFGGKLGWLVGALLLVPIQNAIAQDPNAQGQISAPASNRMPIPHGTQAPSGAQPQAAVPQPTAVPASHPAHHKKSAAQTAVEPQVAQVPPPPQTLEQMPPSAPHVAYQNGQLSINAHNSTLGQVLRAVQAQTGASMDIPGGASSERVVADLGPGTPQNVLASLLNGSHFNYVIMGIPGGSGGVQKVILTTRQNAAPTQSVQANNVQPQPVPDEDVTPEDDQAATYPDSDVPVNTPMAPNQQGRVIGPNGQPIDQPPPEIVDPNQQNNGVKTPEQLLQELQRMQQQQQQYQQQLNPSNLQPGQIPPEQQQPQQ